MTTPSLSLSLTRGRLSDLANRTIVASLRKKDVSLSHTVTWASFKLIRFVRINSGELIGRDSCFTRNNVFVSSLENCSINYFSVSLGIFEQGGILLNLIVNRVKIA